MGPKNRQEYYMTFYTAKLKLDNNWDEAIVYTVDFTDSRTFNAFKRGFSNIIEANRYLDQMAKTLAACVSGYTVYFRTTPNSGSEYYFVDPGYRIKDYAVAMMKAVHNGSIYEVVFELCRYGSPITQGARPVSNLSAAPATPTAAASTEPAMKTQSVAAEGVSISTPSFASGLGELITYAKSSFKPIKGSRDASSKYVDVYLTSFKLTGSIKQQIVDFPFLGITYRATYMEGAKGTRGDALFAQLRTLVATVLPGELSNGDVKQNDQGRQAVFTADGGKLLIEVEKSTVTETVTISVRKKDKY
jgi:hypothetical protein